MQTAIALARRALDADLHVTNARSREELLAFIAEKGDAYATLVIAGGDGTLAVACDAAAGRDLVLGYIPAGFGNATAHALGLPDHPAALAGVLATGETRPIDLVSVDGRLALFAGVGWDALVAHRYAAAGARRLIGWGVAIAGSLPDLLRRPAVRVTADEAVIHEGPMSLTVISTTPFYGRGLLVNPGARPDAGRLLARVYAGPLPRLALDATRWIARRRPRVAGVLATVIAIASLDGRPIPLQANGDPVGSAAEWRFDLAPAAVRLIGKW